MNQHTIEGDDDGIRLDRWFKRHQPGLPHALLEKHLRKGLIRLDGKKAKTSDRVAAGQVLDIRLEGVQLDARAKKTTAITPEDEKFIQKLVIYKDANVIVINKPYGLPVQGGTKINRSIDSLLDGLMFGEARPKLVHRLDRDTSGVLVLARTSKAAAVLAKAFAGKSLEKTYWALVHGSPLPPKGVVDLPVSKMGATDFDREHMVVDEENGKFARTDYRVIEGLARKFALMELKPQTGRTHQLRVHMQAIGCPIVGDPKYGDNIKTGDNIGVVNQLHLHARRLVIPPLAGGKAIDVTAPLPPHMVSSFKALGIEPPKR